MKINSAKLIFFSATGTTKKIIFSVANGLKTDNFSSLDLTKPKNRELPNIIINEDLLIIALPVYEERIPYFLYKAIEKINPNNKPTILIGVYGNVGSGILLYELADLFKNKATIVAAAEFIGEHSFSSDAAPLSKGRPNQKDIDTAHDFGNQIYAKLTSCQALGDLTISLPKTKLPLMAKVLPKNSARLFTKKPAVNLKKCNKCSVCYRLCPVNAIDKDFYIDKTKCIRCFACVKYCKARARSINYKSSIVKRFLNKANKVQKDPKLYL